MTQESVTQERVTQDAMDVQPFPLPRPSGCPFDPANEHRALHEQGPISRVEIWNKSTPWFVTGHEEHKALLSDPALSSDVHRAGFPHFSEATSHRQTDDVTFLHMDDPEHARQRRMLMPRFTKARMEMMRPGIQQMVDEHIDAMLAGPKPVDFVDAFALSIPSLVIAELLGVPHSDLEKFQDLTRVLVTRTTGVDDARNAQNNLLDYLEELINRKLEAPTDDLLSQLAVDRVRTGELTVRELATTGFLVLVAGHETTSNMMALATYAFLRDQEQLDKLLGMDDPKQIAGAVEECLRMIPIFQMGRRRVLKDDVEINGLTLKSGEGMILSSELANRDPKVFENPDVFDIERDARRHVAFGYGVHQCLGQPLARVELQVVLGTLFKRIPTLRLAVDESKLEFKNDGLSYGLVRLPLTW
ncbi:cytochrome P450 [Pseudarthrobacter sulfonivorans]|uniref:cytochrome P450 n=1 Tax=Pseudarthrobacter sulfonivorans TaxID=121292 RepID=UPI001CC3137A|nr:cytochrome P450 [Pseudarthrobacter sulfonivorans]